MPATGAYSISPLIANGLSFNTDTGEISGTPANPASAQTYIITATNTNGTDIASVIITVNAVPIIVANPSTLIATVGTAITPTTIMSTGGPVTSYGIALVGGQSLNAATGLDFDPSTGSISGTPTMTTTGALTYGIFATNAPSVAGTSVVITILAAPAPDISPSVATLAATQFVAITPITIDAAAGGAVDSYSISPLIANGLSFNTDTGEISGMPTAVASAQTYTITANGVGIPTVTATATVDITVNAADNTAPDAPVITQPTTPTNDDSITISGSAEADATVTLSQNGTALAPTATADSNGAWSIEVSLSADNDGANTFTATATDQAGNASGSSNEVTVTLDQTKPTIAIRNTSLTNPTNDNPIPINLLFSEPLTGFEASDITVTNGTITADSYQVVSTVANGVAVNVTFTITPSADGIVALRIVANAATDAAGNGNIDRGSVFITYDGTAPDVAITSTAQTVNTAAFTLTGTTEAGATVDVLKDGTSIGAATVTAATWTFDVMLTEGANLFTVTASDAAGNVSEVSAAVSITRDSTPAPSDTTRPSVAISSFPVMANIVNGDTVNATTLRYEALFDEAVSGFEIDDITVSGTAGVTTASGLTGAGRFRQFEVLRGNLDGTVIVSIAENIAEDAAGNGNTASDEYTLTIDTTPPVITRNGDAALTIVSGTTYTDAGATASDNIAGTITGSITTSFTLDGAEVASLNSSQLGTYIITYNVSDAASNPAPAVTRTVTVVEALSASSVIATAAGDKIRLQFVDQQLTNNDAAPGDFTLSGAGAAETTVTGLAVDAADGTVLILSLSGNIAKDAAVTLAYTRMAGSISGVSTSTSRNGIVTNFTATAVNTSNIVAEAAVAVPSISISSATVTATVGTAIADISITSNGGAVASYGIAPTLPDGLTLDTSTGTISGTPTAVSASTSYTITATNSSGLDTVTLTIVVNAAVLAPDIPPSATPFGVNLTVGVPISPITILNSGGAATYSFSPDLPAGLSIDSTTGTISGTPTTATTAEAISYTITATNSAGSDSIQGLLTVQQRVAAPDISVSPGMLTFTVGIAVTTNPITITNNGGHVNSYTIEDANGQTLSENTGLSHSADGVIFGTPTMSASTEIYTITATNRNGVSDSATITITVNEAVPSISISSATVTATVGNAIADISITSNGGAVASYGIAPTLPEGLTLDTSTGTISGTPTAVSTSTSYTITATNSSGLDTVTLTITVEAAADTTPPAAPLISTTAQTVNTVAFTLSGTADAAASIQLLRAGNAITSATTDADTNGDWSITFDLTEGENLITATASDSADNTSAASAAVSITLDTVAPTVTFTNPTQLVRTAAFTLTGTTEAGATVDVRKGGTPIGAANVTVTTWSLATTLIEGFNAFTVIATDAAGNTSTATITITLNTLLAEAPVITVINTVLNNANEQGVICITFDGDVKFDGSPNAAFLNARPGDFVVSSDTSPAPTVIGFVGACFVDSVTHNNTIQLTLNRQIAFGETATLSYTKTGTEHNTKGIRRDVTGSSEPLADFSNEPITNNAIEPIEGLELQAAGTFSAANQIFLSFGLEVVTASPDLVAADFTVSGAASSPMVTGISKLAPSALLLTLSANIVGGETITLSYTKTMGSISNASAEELVNFTDYSVTNTRPAPAPVTAPSISISQATVTATAGTAITPITIASTGGAVDSYSIEPALPAGLTLDATTGTISGTPTAAANEISYTITATNASDTDTATVAITVEAAADTTPPSVTISSLPVSIVSLPVSIVNGDTVNATTLQYEVIFSELVSGFDVGDITVTGTAGVATASNLSGGVNGTGRFFEFDVVRGSLDGTVIVSIAENIAEDVAGNGNTASGDYTLTIDTTPPTITLNGDAALTLVRGTDYTDAGATANDNTGGDITGSITRSFTLDGTAATTLNTAQLGTYIITYNVSDAANNPAMAVTRMVTTVEALSPNPDGVIATAAGDKIRLQFVDQRLTNNGAAPGDFSLSGAAAGITVTTLAVDADDSTVLILSLSGNIAKDAAVTLAYTRTAGSISGVFSTGSISSNGIVIDFADTTVDTGSIVAVPSISISSATVTATVGNAIADISITSNGGTVASYGIAPTLPDGLTLDTSNGTISGTPTAVSTSTSYTITATNSSGEEMVTLTITVEAAADTTAPDAPVIIQPTTPTTDDSITISGTAEADATVTLSQNDNALTSSTATADANGNWSIEVTLSADNNGANTFTATATDQAGNISGVSNSVTVTLDNTAPIITLTGANPQIIESGADYTELGATTDDGSVVSIDSSAYRNVVGTYIITYTATDGTNQATATRTVNVVDTTAPTITLTGANPQIIESGADYTELGATTDDGSVVSIDSSAYRNVVGTYIITYTATDGTNQATATRTVNVVDTTAPTITLTGANPQIIESGADYTELGATTDDGSVVSIDSSAYRNVVGTYIITYTATDGTNQATATRTVNVVDTTTPTITLTGANPQIIESGADYTELGATTDDGSVVSIDSSAYRNVVGTYIITYTATDGTNQATATRTVNVVDTTAPTITLTGANPQIIESGADYTELGATTDDGSVVSIDSSAYRNVVGTYIITYTATDGTNQATATRTVNVVDTTTPTITLTGANPQIIESGADYTELGATTDDGSVVSIDSSAYRNVVGTYIITYTATDGTNQATATRTVNVVDTTAPTITLTRANPQTIELGAGYTELGASADDGSEVTIDSSAYRNVVGTYIITYTATDGTNQATATRTVNVVDTTAPIITLTGANPQTIELGAGYTELGASADDGSTVTIDDDAFMDIVGTYTITYTATDGTNPATPVTRTVNVVDTTAPIITLTGDDPQIIEQGAGYTELGATTDDGSTVTIDDDEFMDVVGAYIITYTATDGTNPATPVTRTVNVVDTTAPIITLTGDDPQIIEQGAGYTELGASADDGSTVTIDSSAFTDVVGTYIITYTATDGTNPATPVTRAVNVVDTTAPIITLTGDDPQIIEQGAGYTELGASADDGSEVTIDDDAFMDVVGTYTITYTATDGTNPATPVTRTVNVVDTTAPIITLTGDDPQTIELGAGYTELGASADDGSEVSTDSSAFMDVVGTYTITYTATDGTNPATPVTRTVNVVDTTAPIITLTGDDPQIIEQGAGYTELGASADDGSEVSTDSSAFMDVVGTYTITYTATDGTNPATPVTRAVNVVDTTAPTVAISTTAQTVNTAAFTLAGIVDAGATVDVLKDGTSIGAASVTGTRWSLAVTLDDGANTFTATATDATDNTSDATDAVIITLDTAPSFGSAAITAIANKSYTYTAGTAIPVLTLPKATGGNGALTYSLSPILPQGLTFDTTRRTISGTPEAETASTSYTYIAADSDTNTAATDTASLTFSITVLADGLSEEDIQRLNLAIMPRLTQALVASSAASVERRVDSAFASAETTASYQLDGYQIQFDSETTTTEKLTADLLQKLAGYTRSHKDGNINWKQLLTNSSFLIPLNSADQTGADQASAANTELALWGSGDYTRLSENDSDLDWQGDLSSYQLGLDKRLDNLLLGGMLSWSEGDVDYTLEGDEGSYNHKMTSIHPYLAWNNDHTNLWGSLGYGQGDLTIKQEDNSHSTDTNLLSLAAGIKGQLISGLSLKSDLLLARTDINAAADMNIAKQTIDSQRFRLLLEIAGQYTLASGGSIKPMLEIGARYDGGDGNSGTGAVLGAGMRYANLTGLTLEGNLHALVGQGNYKEWGIQASISLDPGTDKLGLAFSLRPGYGYNGSSSDTSALWQQSLPQSNLHNSAVDYSAPDYDARLGARLSYGLLAPSLVGLLTPYSEITLGTINSYRLGIRWQGTARFDLHLFGERRESSGNLEGSRGADQAIQLEGRIHF